MPYKIFIDLRLRKFLIISYICFVITKNKLSGIKNEKNIPFR